MVELLKRAYAGKRVLVTGDTGFKGSWLCIWLKLLGADVLGYGLEPYTAGDNFSVCRLSERIKHIGGDVRDFKVLKSVFEEFKPQYVFHLAAQPLVRLSYIIPRETYETNVMGTVNVLECIKNSLWAKVGVIITTDKCYENKEQFWGYREKDTLGGFDPYSSSKACVEILTESYRKAFFSGENYSMNSKSIATVRAGNVIGGGDWQKNRIVPDCIRSLREKEEIIIRNPKGIRPFQHVMEPLYGYLLLGSKMWNSEEYNSPWNFGPKNESIVRVDQLVELIIDRWGEGSWKSSSFEREEFHETNILTLDSTKARVKLGWEGNLSIGDCIDRTVYWYKNFEKEDPYDICTRQIEEYSSNI